METFCLWDHSCLNFPLTSTMDQMERYENWTMSQASAHSNYWKVIWRLAVSFYALNDDRMACSGKTARSSPFLAFFLVCWLIHFVCHGWAPFLKQSHWMNDMGSSVWGVQWSDNQKRQLSEPHPKHVSHPQLTCYCLSRACLCPTCGNTDPLW